MRSILAKFPNCPGTGSSWSTLQDWPIQSIMYRGNYHLSYVNADNLLCLHTWGGNTIQAKKLVCTMTSCMLEVLYKHSFCHRHYQILPLMINSQTSANHRNMSLIVDIHSVDTVLRWLPPDDVSSVIASCPSAHVMIAFRYQDDSGTLRDNFESDGDYGVSNLKCSATWENRTLLGMSILVHACQLRIAQI